MNPKSMILLALVASFGMSQAHANTVTLTMDEVAHQSVDGLTVTKGGESFTFHLSGSTPAYYNATGAGTETHVQDPSICCMPLSSSLTVNFSVPVTQFAFGYLETVTTTSLYPLLTQVTVSNGYSFHFPAGLQSGDTYVEGYPTATFLTPVTGFTVTPDPIAGVSGVIWAFDNLTITTAETPLPATLPLFASGLGGFGMFGWCRRRRKTTATITVRPNI